LIRRLFSNKEIRARLNILVLLTVLLGLLIYLFLLLNRPPRPVSPVRVKGITHLFSVYGAGREQKELFYHPDGVATDKNGKIYVTDSGNHRVMVFNNRGKFLFKFGKKGFGKGELTFPLGIAVAPNGNIYVTSMVASRLSIFDPQGKLVKEVIVDRPIRPFIAGKQVYIATAGQIWVTNLKGEALKVWGTRGRGPRQFQLPNGIAVSKDGTIYVSDTQNDRLQALDKKGNLLWIKGEPPTSLNDPERLFGLGMGLSLDEKKGRIYVVDAFHHTLRVFDKKGKPLAELGKRGTGDGAFEYPSTIASLGGNTFVVADKFNNRIQAVIVNLPGERPPMIPQARIIPRWLGAALALAALLLIGWLLRRYLLRLIVLRRTAKPDEKPEGA